MAVANFGVIRRELAALGLSKAAIDNLELILFQAKTADTASSGHTSEIAAIQAADTAQDAAITAAADDADLALALASAPPRFTLDPHTFSWAADATGSLTYDGTADVSAALTLATVNSNVGAFGSGTSVASFTVNAKGLITAASSVAITSAPKWTTARTLSFTGAATGSGSLDGSADLAIALSLASIATGNLLANTSGSTAAPVATPFASITGVGSAAKWATARTLSFTGDVTGSGSVDGSANAATALTIANAAVTLAKIANASANSKLLGAGSSGSGAAYSELSLGTGLAMSGTTLSATAAGAPSFGIYEASATKPLAASFTWVNQGDATLADGTGSLILTAPINAAINVRMIVQTAPAATYVIYFRGMPEAAAAGTVSFGLVLRNSTSGRFLFLAFTSPSTTAILQRVWQRWASATSFNANINTAVSQWIYTPWFRITVTSTTATPEMSPNGWDWSAAGVAETLSTYVTATGGTVDQIGIGVQVNNASGVYHLNAFQTTAPT